MPLTSAMGPKRLGNTADRPPTSEPPASRPRAGETYRIAWGDTLSAIALKAYGDASLWPAIAAANPGKVGKNALILAHQTLELPTLKQAQEAMASKATPQKTTLQEPALEKPAPKQAKWSAEPTSGTGPAWGNSKTPAPASTSSPKIPPSPSPLVVPAQAAPVPAPPVAPTAAPGEPAFAVKTAVGSIDLEKETLTTVAGASLRAAAAEMFRVQPNEVGALHLQSLFEQNPALGSAELETPLAAGTVLQVSNTPRLLGEVEQELSKLQASAEALLAADANASPGDEVRLSDAGRQAVQDDLKHFKDQAVKVKAMVQEAGLVKEVGALQARLAQEPDAKKIEDAFAPLFEEVRREAPKLVGVVWEARLGQHEAAQTVNGATEQSALANVVAQKKVFDEALAEAKDDGAKVELLRNRAAISMKLASTAGLTQPALVEYVGKSPPPVSKGKPLPVNVTQSLEAAQNASQTHLQAAETDLAHAAELLKQGLSSVTDPKVRGAQELAIADLEAVRQSLPRAQLGNRATLYQAVNDPVSLLRTVEEEFGLVLGGKVAQPLTPTVTGKVGADEKDALFFGTEVKSLSDSQLASVEGALKALPEDKREEALGILTRYGQLASETQIPSGVHVASQLLSAMAGTSPRWGVEAQLLRASHLMNIGALQKARETFEQSAGAIAALPESNPAEKELKTLLADRSNLGRARSLLQLAQEGGAALSWGPNEKEGAALKLSDFRKQLEKTHASKGVVADVIAMEIEALLATNQTVRAEEALKTLRSGYSDLPAVQATLAQMDANYKQGGAVAFTKVLTAEMANFSAQDAAFSVGVGVLAAGLILGPVGWGAMLAIGVGAGFGAMALTHAVRGSKRTWAAGSTGLTSITNMEAVTNTAIAGANLIGAGATAGALSKVGGMPGLRAAALGTRGGPQSIALLERQALRLELASPGLFQKGILAARSDPVRMRLAQQVLADEAYQAALSFGAKLQLIPLAVSGVALGQQYWALRTAPLTDEERARQMGKMNQALGVMGIQLVAMGGAFGAARRSIYRGTPKDVRVNLQKLVSQGALGPKPKAR